MAYAVALKKLVKAGALARQRDPLWGSFPSGYYGVVPLHVLADVEEYCR